MGFNQATVVTGEYVRQNVTENQEGVELHLDMQFIDVNVSLYAVEFIFSLKTVLTYLDV